MIKHGDRGVSNVTLIRQRASFVSHLFLFCFGHVVFPGVYRILNELCPNPGYPSPQLPMMKRGSPPFYFCLFGEESGVTL